MEDTKKENDDWRFLNDWPIRRYLSLCIGFVICLVLFSLARYGSPDSQALSYLGYPAVLGVIMIPGTCILRLLKVHDLGFTKSLLISMPLGIGFIFLVGFSLNLFYYAGIYGQPLSFEPINIAYPIIMLALVVLVYFRERDYVARQVQHVIDMNTLLSWGLAALLPTIAIIGATVAGYDGSRQILLYLLVVLCLAPFALLTQKVKNYELFIFSISLALLLHRSLLTNFLTGYDIFSEYTGATYVISNGFWNISESSGILVGAGANTSLAIVSFIPIIHNIAGIETVMIFKFLFQLLYSFIPVAIYVIVKDQIGQRSAVIAAMIFIAFAEYYGLMIMLAKQEIAEIFLVMMLLVMFETKLSSKQKWSMVAIFLIGVMVSHYAIAFLSLGVLGLMIIITLFFSLANGWRSTRSKPLRSRSYLFIKYGLKDFLGEHYKVKLASLVAFIAAGIFFLMWYSYTASGSMLGIFEYGGGVVSGVVGSDPETGQHSLRDMDMLEYILIDQGTLLHNVPKMLFITAQLFCMIGVIYAIWNLKGVGKKANKDFLALGLVGGILILMAYTVPNFSTMFYYGRLFHFAMIFLSGFFLLGIMGFISSIMDLVHIKKRSSMKISRRIKKAGYVAALVLVSAVLFTNTSTIYSLTGDYNTSFALDDSVSWSVYSDSDVAGAKWASESQHIGNGSVVADWHRFPIFGGLHVSNSNLLYNWNSWHTDSLIYISTWNTKYHYVYPLDVKSGSTLTYTEIESILSQVNDTYGIPYSAGQTSYYYIPVSTPDTNEASPYIYNYEPAGEYYLEGLAVVLLITFALAVIINRYKRTREGSEIETDADDDW